MFEKRRADMVEQCVVGAGITDERVIRALSRVPRHLFVEPAIAHQAYQAKALPIGFGQTISHPTTVAYMTTMLQVKPDQRVLEIGTGSGYQAAVLAECGAKVFSIERIAALARRAQALFDQLGYFTIAVHIGDGSLGWTAHAPYDRILSAAASLEVPTALLSQLADGGRLLCPVGDDKEQVLRVITREGEKLHCEEHHLRRFVPLIGRKGWSGE